MLPSGARCSSSQPGAIWAATRASTILPSWSSRPISTPRRDVRRCWPPPTSCNGSMTPISPGVHMRVVCWPTPSVKSEHMSEKRFDDELEEPGDQLDDQDKNAQNDG